MLNRPPSNILSFFLLFSRAWVDAKSMRSPPKTPEIFIAADRKPRNHRKQVSAGVYKPLTSSAVGDVYHSGAHWETLSTSLAFPPYRWSLYNQNSENTWENVKKGGSRMCSLPQAHGKAETVTYIIFDVCLLEC